MLTKKDVELILSKEPYMQQRKRKKAPLVVRGSVVPFMPARETMNMETKPKCPTTTKKATMSGFVQRVYLQGYLDGISEMKQQFARGSASLDADVDDDDDIRP